MQKKLNEENKSLRDENVEKALKKFRAYLRLQGYRNTEERNIILREIYSSDGHFNVDELFIRLRNKNLDVSRATIYNTLDLLVKSKLVMHNSFGHKHQHYESANEYLHHDHLICQQCGEVYEFTDNMIEKKKVEVCEKLGFKLDTHSLQIFAECQKHNCEKKKPAY